MYKLLPALAMLLCFTVPVSAGEPSKSAGDVQTGRSVATTKPPQKAYWLNEDLNRLSSLLPKDAPVFTDKTPDK